MLIKLLFKRRFLPLFSALSLEAFNDNAIRSVFIMLVSFQLSHDVRSAAILSSLSAVVFNLPFILFSHLAGQLADKFNKARLTRLVKWIEVVCMALAGYAILYSNVSLLMFCIFLMGLHSTLFGPIKYAILPELLRENELFAANAWVESATFIMILLGFTFGIYLFNHPLGREITSFVMFALAVVGLISSFFIPRQLPILSPNLPIKSHPFKQIKHMIAETRKEKRMMNCIFLIAWFWYFGVTLQTQFAAYVKYTLAASADVVAILIATLALGISFGAFAGAKLLRHGNGARHTPFAMLLTSLFTILWVASSPAPVAHQHLMSVATFFSQHHHWLLLTEIFLLSASAGFYVLPLYVMLQHSAAAHRARTIALLNIVSAIAMFLAGGVAILLAALHISLSTLFLLTALLNIAVAIYACSMLPRSMLHAIFKWCVRCIYRIKVRGLENYHAAGEHVIIIANHSSFLDVPLLACFLPDELSFVINRHVAQSRLIKPFLSLAKTFSIDTDNPMVMKHLIQEAVEGSRMVIFPEGRITTTGSLMKIYEGAALIADRAQINIVPIQIDGVQFTRFSPAKGFISRFIPELRITICKPQKLDVPEKLLGRARREKLTLALHDMMNDMLFDSFDKNISLFSKLLKARKKFGGNRVCLEDGDYKRLSYRQLITKSYVIGQEIVKQSDENQMIGVMLATSLAANVLFFACHAFSRIPAIINFTSGFASVYKTCQAANIKIIYTAKKFIKIAKLEQLVLKLEQHNIRIIYLEDVAASLSTTSKIMGLLRSQLDIIYKITQAEKHNSQDMAVVLFTSGSEGVPKGVAISHYNINSNHGQMLARVDVTMNDVFFNTLPMFHCFGLTAATLLPIFCGCKTILYPSPLHFRVIPEMIYDRDATFLFSTNTFLSGYARAAHPYDFYRIRYIFAGAEALREATRKLYHQRFGIRIFEGYGVTETTPVIAVNTAMHYKAGTVGRALPKIKTRLEKVEGIEQGGRLLLQGPNVMLGYMKVEKPGVLQAVDTWYDTGDIVEIDESGFIKIVGRAKRFAKLGGEMISLTAVEDMILALWPDDLHAVISIANPKKGEELMLISEHKDCKVEEIVRFAREHGYAELMIPKKLTYLEQLPVLGSGKVDYVKLKAEFAAP